MSIFYWPYQNHNVIGQSHSDIIGQIHSDVIVRIHSNVIGQFPWEKNHSMHLVPLSKFTQWCQIRSDVMGKFPGKIHGTLYMSLNEFIVVLDKSVPDIEEYDNFN